LLRDLHTNLAVIAVIFSPNGSVAHGCARPPRPVATSDLEGRSLAAGSHAPPLRADPADELQLVAYIVARGDTVIFEENISNDIKITV
jgi:hypothetical protein